VTEEEIAAIEADLSSDPNIREYTLFTPEQNFETFKANLGKGELFADFSADYIPYTFAIRLHDPAGSEDFKSHMEGLPGVRKVDLELKVMQFLSKAIVWVNYCHPDRFCSPWCRGAFHHFQHGPGGCFRPRR